METDLPSLAKQLKALDRADIKNWLKRGELLNQARELNPSDDAFRTWLRQNALAKTTAYKAMAAWRHFSDCPESGHFTKEAMELLAQNAAAREEAIEIAGSKKITRAIAKQLLTKHGPPTFEEAPAANPKAPLSSYATSGYEEIFNVEGYTVTIEGSPTPTASDLLGVIMEIQRQVRNRLRSAA